jgi:hypothetical protein
MRLTRGLAVLFWIVSEGVASVQARHEVPTHPAMTVVVALTGRDRLPSLTRQRMAEAVSHTWSPSGVQIVGLDVLSAEPPTLRIDLANVPGEGSAKPPHVLAKFARAANVVTVSLPAAEETVLLGVPRPTSAMPPGLWHLALGDVLGRAIAHEIGHVLLGPAHRRRGVMRAVFDPRELVNPRSGRFGLDPMDAARLAAQLPALRLSFGLQRLADEDDRARFRPDVDIAEICTSVLRHAESGTTASGLDGRYEGCGERSTR